MATLIVDDKTQPSKWFVWVKSDEGQPDADWHDYVSSVPEGVMKASEAGHPVTHWMRLSSQIPMSAEAINGSKQQLEKR